MSKKQQKPPFEESINELEQLVNTLESGDLPLEEALSAFEKGVKLTKECQTQLNQAEQKVALLVGEGAKTQLIDFEKEEK